ncbi:hypothetical protein NPIL_234121 [Nephila pilipes]|uniref:Uncharacterized protein n=1 Tax=Nephila pilipes TaxID=299642 RepID=A0A8X6PRU8_NEPPI|nr:hypothetical protein NPIL_444871 [Nephila pilipes]GFT85597.1 hypothetical protein NPIL_234121 [Nephila pilipes]
MKEEYESLAIYNPLHLIQPIPIRRHLKDKPNCEHLQTKERLHPYRLLMYIYTYAKMKRRRESGKWWELSSWTFAHSAAIKIAHPDRTGQTVGGGGGRDGR